MKIRTVLSILFLSALTIGFLQSCKNKEPSVLKVFVRSAANDLLKDARVVVIADIPNNESSNEFVDTLLTNESGFVEFNMQPYFDGSGSAETGDFDIICKKDDKQGTGYARCRVHTTSVETIYLEP